jgi:hypothetical protein
MSITRPNIIQQENRLRTLPDEALRAMLLQMGQTGQVGSPEYLLAAGEMQARKNIRQQAAMGKPQQPPVIADLLSGIDMQGMAQQGQPQMPQGQPQMAMAPEEAGGVAGLPAENMEMMDQPQYAGGGIVAFQTGGVPRAPFGADEGRALAAMTPEERKNYYREKFQAREAALKSGSPARSSSAIPRKAPGVLGLASRLAGPLLPAATLGWDSLFGTSDEDRQTLAGQDAARATLRQAGFSDKDIAAMPLETMYRMASGYQPENRSGIDRPMTVADANQAIPSDMALRSAPGLTSEQSAANIAAAQQGPGGAQKGSDPDAVGLGAISKQIADLQAANTRPDLGKIGAEVDEMYKQAGVSMDPYAQYKQDLAAEKEAAGADRTQAGWMRALEAGLGIMGGTSPYAAVNIGEGSKAAARGAMEDIKEFKKLDRDRTRALADISVAENNLKRGVTDKKISRYDSAVERYTQTNLELRKLTVATELKRMELAASKGDRNMAEALKAAQTAWKNLPEAEKLAGKLDEDEFIQSRATQYLGFLKTGTFGNAASPKVDASQWGTPRVKTKQ